MNSLHAVFLSSLVSDSLKYPPESSAGFAMGRRENFPFPLFSLSLLLLTFRTRSRSLWRSDTMSINPDAAIRDASIQAATRIAVDKQQLANWNLSESIAIKRILQIPWVLFHIRSTCSKLTPGSVCLIDSYLGVTTNDVSLKLYKPDWSTTDVNNDDKKTSRQVFEAFMKRCKEDPELGKMNWTLVLYQYEVGSFRSLDSLHRADQ